MAALLLNRTAARQALHRTWRLQSIRYQHAVPAVDQPAEPLPAAEDQTATRASVYRIMQSQQRQQTQQSTQQHASAAIRMPQPPTRSDRQGKPRRNKDGLFTITGPELRITDDGPLMGSPIHEMPAFEQPFVDTDGQLKGHKKGGTFVVPGRWLREMCTCTDCRHPDTAQKKINVLQDSQAGKVTHIKEISRAETGKPAFEVNFADGHRSTIPAAAIHNRNRGRMLHAHRTGQVPVAPWKSSIASNPPSVSYDSVQAGPGMADLLLKIRQSGFCFVENTPPAPDATEQLLQSIGPIRTTHYGGFYDFTSDLSSKDTAYTSEALEPHTDNTYFTEPAGLQALHLLSHTSGATSAFPNPDVQDSETLNDPAGAWEPNLGGESSLVDGFAAANHLFHTNPEAYRLLSSFGLHAHASGNEGISIQPSQAYPTFQHDWITGKLTQIRWNTADRAGTTVPWELMEEWYDAAAEFDAIVNSKEFQYWFSLKPGKVLIFDNWRCMHGRAAFTGKRRMCGGYIPRDDFISKFKATNLSREEVEASTVTG